MAQSTASLVSTDDASINAASTGSTGNWGYVEVYGKPGGGIVGIFKFALPTSAGGAHVTSASLRLWVVSIHNGGGTFSVHAASGSWSESSVTYGNGPSKGALLTTVSITSANQFYDIDVTAHIASRMTASASTATIWIEGGTDYKKFECHSRRDDRTNPPTLSVVTSSTPSGGCERPVVSSSPPPSPSIVPSSTAPPPSASPSHPPLSTSPNPSPPPHHAAPPLQSPSPGPPMTAQPPYPPLPRSATRLKKHFLDWETGTIESGLSEPLEPNFSLNGVSSVETGGVRYGNTPLANLNAMSVPWARDGTHVLKVYVDGRNHRIGGGSDGDYGHRAELGTALEAHKFHPGDYQFYTASFWLVRFPALSPCLTSRLARPLAAWV